MSTHGLVIFQLRASQHKIVIGSFTQKLGVSDRSITSDELGA